MQPRTISRDIKKLRAEVGSLEEFYSVKADRTENNRKKKASQAHVEEDTRRFLQMQQQTVYDLLLLVRRFQEGGFKTILLDVLRKAGYRWSDVLSRLHNIDSFWANEQLRIKEGGIPVSKEVLSFRINSHADLRLDKINAFEFFLRNMQNVGPGAILLQQGLLDISQIDKLGTQPCSLSRREKLFQDKLKLYLNQLQQRKDRHVRQDNETLKYFGRKVIFMSSCEVTHSEMIAHLLSLDYVTSVFIKNTKVSQHTLKALLLMLLKSNCSLECLVIAGTPIRDQHLKMLIMRVLMACKIKHVCLEHNELTLKGIMLITAGIVAGNSAVEVSFRGNRVCDRSVRCLQIMLRQVHSLHIICLQGSSLSLLAKAQLTSIALQLKKKIKL